MVRGILFCIPCLCCGFVSSFFSYRCGDTVVGTGVELALVFVRVACLTIRSIFRTVLSQMSR